MSEQDNSWAQTTTTGSININAVRTLREHALDSAKKCVVGQRDESYGTPEHSFHTISQLWNTWVEARTGYDPKFTSGDVAIMLDLLKTARLAYDISHEDSWIDKAGYSACGYEVTAPYRTS